MSKFNSWQICMQPLEPQCRLSSLLKALSKIDLEVYWRFKSISELFKYLCFHIAKYPYFHSSYLIGYILFFWPTLGEFIDLWPTTNQHSWFDPPERQNLATSWIIIFFLSLLLHTLVDQNILQSIQFNENAVLST